MGHRPALAAVRGVVFDMDGTLTAPFLIDFTAMRARTGILEGDLLAEIEKMETRADRERMTAIVEEEEEKGMARLTIQKGYPEIIEQLRLANKKVALVTRNSQKAMDKFFEETATEPGLFDVVFSRSFPLVKPNPAILQHIAELWKLSPNDILMVGDSYSNDIVCANGTYTIWSEKSVFLVSQPNAALTLSFCLPPSTEAGCLSCLLMNEKNRQ
mmetsp:Transcript_13162/g.34441  ORF Transcript_13162/g.34441 Transcript_13162/m.34441 type:complete len:214 (-) Transcript_13162:1157-1798(-)